MPHGHSHGHSHGLHEAPDVRVGTVARTLLTILLALAAAATIFGLVRYWPGDAQDVDRVATSDFAAPGVTFPIGLVQRVLPACEGADSQVGAPPSEGQGGDVTDANATCGAISVSLEPPTGSPDGSRPSVTISVPKAISDSGLTAGDKVQLLKIPAQNGTNESYSFLQVQRGSPLALMFLLFIIVVALVARLRGILAMVGLAFGGLVLIKFMLPALLHGQPGLRVALIGCAAIMFVVLYLAHGLSVRTSTALAGTLFGVAITAALGVFASGLARLSGVADDEGATLAAFNEAMSPRELLTCAIIVAGLGVLNDVTITQSSAVWELRAAAPEMGRAQLFRSGMRIGRDHIASTIYTIVFAYAGAALPVLLLLFLYDRPVLDLLQTESMAEEIVRTLASAIGLVIAVPATTAIAALTIGGGARLAAPASATPPELAPATVQQPRPTAADLHGSAGGSRPPETRAEARARGQR